MNLAGMIAFVTGAANGIGEATSRRLAQAGATVVLADIDPRGEAIAAELGPQHRFLKLDVSDEAQWASAMETVRRDLGGLNILFLNAGVQLRPLGAPAGDAAMKWLTPDSYRRVFKVNGDGVILGALAGFPVIRDSGGGIIIATASTAAVDFYPGDPIYSYTKAGVLAFVRSLAKEFETHGVRICAVGPGSIDTRMYPTDRRSERSDAAQSRPADPLYLGNAVLTVIERGKSGDIWYARPDDKGYFTYQPPSLPGSPVQADAAAGRQFVPASTDGAMLDGRPIEDLLGK